jgi:hypothetical protein
MRVCAYGNLFSMVCVVLDLRSVERFHFAGMGMFGMDSVGGKNIIQNVPSQITSISSLPNKPLRFPRFQLCSILQVSVCAGCKRLRVSHKTFYPQSLQPS